MRLDQLEGVDGEGYILLRNGKVQILSQRGLTGLLVAKTHKAAKRLRTRLNLQASIGRVGSVQGESLDGQFLASTEFGATGIWLTDGATLQFLEPRPRAL